MADEKLSDVKETAPSGEAKESSTGADAIVPSSGTQSTDKAGEQANQSLSEYLAENVEALKQPGEETDAEVKVDEQPSDSKIELDKEQKEGGEKEDATKDEKVEEGKPVPYERFQEVVAERNQVKQTFEQVQPAVESYNKIQSYCESNGITPEQFSQTLEVQALLNSDPEEALKRLLPIVEGLQGFTGNKLPADLQGEVDSGELSLARAKEIAQFRAKTQFGEKKSQYDQQRQQQERQQSLQRELMQGIETWETAKRKSDPDYKPAANGTEGKWELVRDKYLAMLNQTDGKGNYANPVRNTAEMVALMDKAYASVNAFYARLGGKKLTRPGLSSSRSSSTTTKTTAIEDAPSMAEAIQIAITQRQNSK